MHAFVLPAPSGPNPARRANICGSGVTTPPTTVCQKPLITIYGYILDSFYALLFIVNTLGVGIYN